MTRHQPTNPDTSSRWALTPQQHAAADLLAAGTSVTDAAASIGVTRQTVSEWLHHHHGFRAALNQRRQELWAGVADRLRALLPKAVTVLERAINEGTTPLAAAVHVLRACAMYGQPQPIGPTDPDDLDVQERERATDRLRRHFAAF